MQITDNTIRAIYNIQKEKIMIKIDNTERLESDKEVIKRLKENTTINSIRK